LKEKIEHKEPNRRSRRSRKAKPSEEVIRKDQSRPEIKESKKRSDDTFAKDVTNTETPKRKFHRNRRDKPHDTEEGIRDKESSAFKEPEKQPQRYQPK
jgi:hypothetical protein